MNEERTLIYKPASYVQKLDWRAVFKQPHPIEVELGELPVEADGVHRREPAVLLDQQVDVGADRVAHRLDHAHRAPLPRSEWASSRDHPGADVVRAEMEPDARTRPELPVHQPARKAQREQARLHRLDRQCSRRRVGAVKSDGVRPGQAAAALGAVVGRVVADAIAGCVVGPAHSLAEAFDMARDAMKTLAKGRAKPCRM